MSTNPEDDKRDRILRYLYKRHKTTRGIKKIPVGIRELQSEMKKDSNMNQAEVSSNLDYLIQVGWVKEVVKDRSFKTAKGMEISSEQIKYKISDIGINHLEAATAFKKPHTGSHINITNIHGVTVLGDGNIVNTEFTDLSRALDALETAISESDELEEEIKLDALGDVSTIKTQIAKKHPNGNIIKSAWNSLDNIAKIASIAEIAYKVGQLIGNIVV